MGVQYIMVSSQASRRLLVLFLMFILCHSQDTINKTQTLQTDTTIKTGSTGDLRSVIHAAISDNAPVFNALNDTGLVVNLPSAVSLSDLSKSTWSLSSVDNENSAKPILGSVPVVASFSPDAPETSATDIKAITDNGTEPAIHEEVSALNDQKKDNIKNVSTEHSGQLKTQNKQDVSKASAGLYISMDKIARKKRQVITESILEQNGSHERVLLLVNSKTPNNETTPKDTLDGSWLMLASQPDVSFVGLDGSSLSDPVITVKSRNNLQEVLNSGPAVNESSVGFHVSLSEVVEGLPAIQRISDLNNVELPLTTSLTSSTESVSQEATGSSNLPLDIEFLTSEQVRSLLQLIPAVSDNSNLAPNDSLHSTVQNTPDFHQSQDPRLVKITQDSLDNRNMPNTPTNLQSRRVPTIFRVSSNLARNAADRDSLIKTGQPQARPPVESRLAMQSSVSSQRITSPPQTSTTQRQGRPLVQAISRENLRQQIQGRRIIQPQIRRSDTQRSSRTQPARQTSRRSRPTPSDPFTQRFSAGFLRGSNLLHQPPLQMRGFDGNNVGFNTLPPMNNGLPPFLGPPPMFGIPGIPNMFLGPSTL